MRPFVPSRNIQDNVIGFLLLNPIWITSCANEINERSFIFAKGLAYNAIHYCLPILNICPSCDFQSEVYKRLVCKGHSVHINYPHYFSKITSQEVTAIEFTHCVGELSQLHKDKIIHLKSLPYNQYLKSEHWRTIRKHALEVAKYRCQVCNDNEKLEVHHRIYANLGDEDISDLTVLCQLCHADIHRRKSELKRKIRPFLVEV